MEAPEEETEAGGVRSPVSSPLQVGGLLPSRRRRPQAWDPQPACASSGLAASLRAHTLASGCHLLGCFPLDPARLFEVLPLCSSPWTPALSQGGSCFQLGR